MKKIIKHSGISLFLLLLLTNPVNASLINFTLSGEITVANANPFNVTVGDTVTATGTYDDSLFIADTSSPGVTFLEFHGNNDMVITIGNTGYTDAMDSLGGADLLFYNNSFDGLIYEASNGSFTSYGFLVPNLADFEGTGIAGNWSANSFSTSPVPVPGAVWLFSSGLVFLASLFRRRTLINQ